MGSVGFCMVFSLCWLTKVCVLICLLRCGVQWDQRDLWDLWDFTWFFHSCQNNHVGFVGFCMVFPLYWLTKVCVCVFICLLRCGVQWDLWDLWDFAWFFHSGQDGPVGSVGFCVVL